MDLIEANVTFPVYVYHDGHSWLMVGHVFLAPDEYEIIRAQY